MQHGIAIPHGKTDAVDSLAVALAMKKEGVDFGSLDGKPARIFVMTLSPLGKAGPHITYLSEISKLLNKSSIRERLLNCETEEEMKRVMLSG
jgi:PTS system nitrogen regulatory IIA component